LPTPVEGAAVRFHPKRPPSSNTTKKKKRGATKKGEGKRNSERKGRGT